LHQDIRKIHNIKAILQRRIDMGFLENGVNRKGVLSCCRDSSTTAKQGVFLFLRRCYSAHMNFIPKTIRGQIMMAFLVCFVFMAIIIALNYNYFSRLSESMQFFELAEDLNSTILEMRRYEKNYFLYRQEFNYEENITYTNQLALTLQRERDYLIRAIGQDNYGQFMKN